MIKPVAKRKSTRTKAQEPLFVRRARRAMLRAARKVAAENKRLGLPLQASRVDD
jgi:hypothetical protein